MKHILVLFTLLIALTAFSVSASAQVIFSHPYDYESTNAYSSASTPTFTHQSYTDFYYNEAFTVTDFHWWGTTGSDNPGLGSFNFQIYSHDDASGQPGSLLYEELISGDANAVSTGDAVDGVPDALVYSYGFDLTTPFISNGGHYWFSVMGIPVNGTTSSNWYWALGDDYVYDNDWQMVEGGNWVNPAEADFAFEITGYTDVVPEPATMTLFGLGLLGMALKRRRKK